MTPGQNDINEILTQVTEEKSSNTLPTDTHYNEIERESIATHLSSKYRKALDQEHSTDLVSANTEQVLRDGAVLAAQQIVSLAVHSSNPNTRLKAATYIVDRVLGPVGKENLGDKFGELLVHISKGVSP